MWISNASSVVSNLATVHGYEYFNTINKGCSIRAYCWIYNGQSLLTEIFFHLVWIYLMPVGYYFLLVRIGTASPAGMACNIGMLGVCTNTWSWVSTFNLSNCRLNSEGSVSVRAPSLIYVQHLPYWPVHGSTASALRGRLATCAQLCGSAWPRKSTECYL